MPARDPMTSRQHATVVTVYLVAGGYVTLILAAVAYTALFATGATLTPLAWAYLSVPGLLFGRACWTASKMAAAPAAARHDLTLKSVVEAGAGVLLLASTAYTLYQAPDLIA